MDEQITTALIILAITIIGGITTLVKVLFNRLAAELAKNTVISTQARDASDGRLSEVLNMLEEERGRRLDLESEVTDRNDRIAFIFAKHPEVTPTMINFRDRRAARHPRRPTEPATGETHPLSPPPDDPTGTDAGAHPGG